MCGRCQYNIVFLDGLEMIQNNVSPFFSARFTIVTSHNDSYDILTTFFRHNYDVMTPAISRVAFA